MSKISSIFQNANNDAMHLFLSILQLIRANSKDDHLSHPKGLFMSSKAETSSLNYRFLGIMKSSIITLIPFCFIYSFMPYSNLSAPSKMLLYETTPPALLLTTYPFASFSYFLSCTVLWSPNLYPQVHDQEDVNALHAQPLQFFFAASCCW